MLTMCHDETMVKPPRSRGGPPTEDNTQLKPQCIVDYNNKMSSVDRQDAVLQPYSAARKSMKWYKKLLFHLLQVALLNAHVLYSKSAGNQTFLQFSHDVIADVILSGDVTSKDSIVRLTERHFPEKLQPSATWSKPQARCRVCYKSDSVVISDEVSVEVTDQFIHSDSVVVSDEVTDHPTQSDIVIVSGEVTDRPTQSDSVVVSDEVTGQLTPSDSVLVEPCIT